MLLELIWYRYYLSVMYLWLLFKNSDNEIDIVRKEYSND